MGDVEFLLGLFTHDGTPAVTKEDFDGSHGAMLRRWQRLGVVSREPSHLRPAGCPHCDEGMPYLLGGRYLCHLCRAAIDSDYLLLWTVDLRRFLIRIADCLHLRGEVRPVVASLWQLGTGQADAAPVECFYCRWLPMADLEQRRVRAYRRLLVFHGPTTVPEASSPTRWVPLVELFGPDGLLVPCDLEDLLRVRGRVSFDSRTGALRVGETWLGEVPLWSREYFFLACLHEHLDQYVSYADLKAEVLSRTGAAGGPDEATFCQKLKSRIKAKYVPQIDRLLGTSNKGDGYRLRGYAQV